MTPPAIVSLYQTRSIALYRLHQATGSRGGSPKTCPSALATISARPVILRTSEPPWIRTGLLPSATFCSPANRRAHHATDAFSQIWCRTVSIPNDRRIRDIRPRLTEVMTTPSQHIIQFVRNNGEVSTAFGFSIRSPQLRESADEQLSSEHFGRRG
jgi:hypothetical protein